MNKRWLVSLCTLVVWFGSATARAQDGYAGGVEPTKLNLPRGPASIEGLGRAFAPSLASGTASYGIDIAVPPSAGGFGPSVALEYDGGHGVSEVGSGWRLTGMPSVRRRTTDGLPQFSAADTFELFGLGPSSGLLQMPDGYFRTEFESGVFARLQVSSDGHRWEARVKGGTTFRFGGKDHEARDGQRSASYLLAEQLDLHGHRIAYEWDSSDSQTLLTSITWNDFSPAVRQTMLFEYEDRPDRHELYSSGILQILRKRLIAIEVRLGGELVRRYELAHEPGLQTRLARVRMVGTDGETALPDLSFTYTSADLSSAGTVSVMAAAPARAPIGDAELCDLNGDGLPDFLIAEAGKYRSYVNEDGNTWSRVVDWNASDSPSVSLSTAGSGLADLDGDGAIDLVVGGGDAAFRYLPGLDAVHWAKAVPTRTAPAFSFEDPELRLADLDGDRRSDAILTTKSGIALSTNRGGTDWGPLTPLGPVEPSQTLLFSDGMTQLCDVNGDGVVDFCHLRSGAFRYWLGRGRGVFSSAREGWGVPSFEKSSPWQLVDLDGNGWVDLTHVEVNRVAYALAEGAGRWGPVHFIEGTPTRGKGVSVQFADMNGSGTVDVVWIDPERGPSGAWRYLELFPRGRAGLLRTIDNGLGKKIRIEYEPASASAARARSAGKPWSTRLNVGMPVVSRIEVDSGLGDPVQSTSFDYLDGTWDPVERTFAGFARGVQTEWGDEFTPSLVTENRFETGMIYRNLRGSLLRSETRSSEGLVHTRTINDYRVDELDPSVDGRPVRYGYMSSTSTEFVEGGSESRIRRTFVETEQDRFGNVVELRNWGEVSGDDFLVGNDELLIRRTFANDADDWLLGYPSEEESLDATGQRLAMRRFRYDGAPFIGLAPGRVVRGDLSRQESWVGPELDSFVLDVATRYDADGHPLETEHADGGGRIYAWDADDHTSILSEEVKLEGARLIETAQVDRRFGSLIQVVEYNGAKSRFEYDALGRLVATFRPGDAFDSPSSRHRYVLSAPLSRVITESTVWPGRTDTERRHILFDGLGRERGTLTEDGTDRVLAGVALRDARGERRKSLRPRFVSDQDVESPPLTANAPGVESWRDALGREIRSRSELGIETRASHAPFEVRTWDGGQTDPKSAYDHTPTTRRMDGLGRTTAIERRVGGTQLTARFIYDGVGRLLSRTDPEGNVARYGYDGRGLRTSVDDPDLGHRSMSYDAMGHLTERRNPDGSKLRYTFDRAGRALTEDWNGDGRPEVESRWDTARDGVESSNYLGKLIEVRDPSGSTRHEYDERGRIVNSLVTIGDQTYASGSRFDNLDREYLHVYPDGSSIRIHRNARGQLAGYGDALRLEFEGDGVESTRRFNTGVTQQLSYDADRRATELLALDVDGSKIEHLRWSFDHAGNLTSQRDLRADVAPQEDRSETYEYDNLYRLRGATGTWGRTSWDYSPSGNLLRRRSTLPDQIASNPSYGKDAGPHALTGLEGRTLTYDRLGRMKSDGQRNYVWNAADQLVSVNSTSGASTTNTFDSQGKRRSRVEVTSSGERTAHAFISPWEEIKDGKLVRYIVHAERRIVRLAPDNGTASTLAKPSTPPYWPIIAVALALLAGAWTCLTRAQRGPRLALALLVLTALAGSGCGSPVPVIEEGSVRSLGRADTLLWTDQLGSLLAETDGLGKAQARFSALPYGVARHDGATETRRYAGAPRDTSVALDHMGARFYAADLGVWTAPDPILLTSPEAVATGEFGTANAYAYANLNPIIARDDDGNFWHIVAGAGIGALMGGGMEAARQYYDHGKVDDWGRVGSAALGGAVSGTITAAMPTIGLLGARASGGLSSAIGGIADRAIQSGGKDIGSLKDVVVDATMGAITAGAGRGASRAAPKPKPPAAPKAPGTEIVQRVMSRAELQATEATGLMRGGRSGPHYATTTASLDAKRAQQRLSLPQRPEVRATLEVPKGRFSAPATADSKYDMPGGGMERLADGPMRVRILAVDAMKGTQ